MSASGKQKAALNAYGSFGTAAALGRTEVDERAGCVSVLHRYDRGEMAALALNVKLQRYAKIAGFLFLFYIGAALSGQLVVASFQVAANFVRTASNVHASELAYRAGLMLELCGAASAIGLGWALYVLLRSAGRDLALLGLLCRVTEGIMGLFGVTLGFARITLYSDPGAGGDKKALVEALRFIAQAEFPIGVTFFSFGSLIFFWLLLRTRSVVPWLAIVGVIGSVCAAVLGTTLLLAPDAPSWIQVLWLPLLISEVGVGLVFLIRGADLRLLDQLTTEASGT